MPVAYLGLPCNLKVVLCRKAKSLCTFARKSKVCAHFCGMGIYEKVGCEMRRVPSYREVRGYRIPSVFSVDAFLSAINYSPKEGDLFVATFPKCGTTWVQHIVGLIYRKGEPFEGIIDFFMSSPFLEMCGAEVADAIDKSPGAIKIHLPYHLAPISPLAKYIYVARNPKDCCVSFYHHVKSLPFYNFQDGTFSDFFEIFLAGQTNFGDYFDNILSWYSHKDDKNVLFLTYENLKRDISGHILKIAGFMGSEHLLSLERDPSLLQTIINRCSFQYMKKHCSYYDNFMEAFEEASDSGIILPPAIKEMVDNYKSAKTESYIKEGNWNFIRKGVIGDWKNHFTHEQNERMEEWIKLKTVGSMVMKLWLDT